MRPVTSIECCSGSRIDTTRKNSLARTSATTPAPLACVRSAAGPIKWNPWSEAVIDQSQTDEVVHRASVPISIEIDEMLSRLPADANLDEIAFDLIAQLAAKSHRPEFIAIFTEALVARQALIELDIKL